MLPLIKTSVQKLDKYKKFSKPKLLSEIKKISKGLKGLRVFMVNSTACGGGVAEILKSLVPLMKDIGINVSWYTIPGQKNFFKVTKKIHSALQSKKYTLSQKDENIYISELKKISNLMKDMHPDIWIIHDPQPAGLISFLPNLHPSIFRLHIDTTLPDKKTWNFIYGFIKKYDKIIVSSKDFLKPRIMKKSLVFTPAINPFIKKNRLMKMSAAKKIIESVGISSSKPLVSQISRFDVFKDPLGVIKAYKIAKKEIPNLQLALVGFLAAKDDPDAVNIYNKVKKSVGKDNSIFLFFNPNEFKNLDMENFTRVIQTASDVILQKSTKEGFGLTVTEAMWKKKPVIGGNVGGIKIQIKNGKNGFLVNNSQEAGARIIEIIKNPKLAKKIGKAARETVINKFLIPRLLIDYLKIIKKLVS